MAAAVKELPQELMAFNLSKLPVKSLLRFKCVRKSWYSLIESPHFIHLHLNNYTNTTNNDCLLVRRCCPTLKRHVLSFHSPQTLAPIHEQITTPFSKQTEEAVTVSGPCNGLICITNHNDQILICNPSTRQFRSLFVPPAFGFRSGYHYDTVAFGFDPTSCEYKLVMIGVYYDNSDHYDPEHEQFYARSPSYRGDREAKVYDFSTDSWRASTGGVVVPNCFLYSPVAVSLNGAFHWIPLRFGGDEILSFLISDEVAKGMPLPEFYPWQNEGRQRDLCVMNNCLALVVYSHPCLEISVMAEYGVKESWSKVFVLGPFFGSFVPLVFCDDDQLLMDTMLYSTNEDDDDVDPLMRGSDDTSQLVACDLRNQNNITRFPIYGLFPIPLWLEYSLDSPRGTAAFDVFRYSESLISVNGIGRGEETHVTSSC